MVTYNTQQRSFDPTAPKPEVEGLLPDIPGGEPGLLPEALTRSDLKVWFTIPLYSDPTIKEEKYELFVDDETEAIATRYWTTPIADSDRYLELTSDWLRSNDGQHRFYYKTTIFNGAENYSLDLDMTLDTKAPVLASDSKLIFPSAVLPPNEITAAYLDDEDNQNQVLATVPDYIPKKVGDVITSYWETSPSGQRIAGTKTLKLDDLSKPVQVAFPGALLRQSNGTFHATYRLADRAGNINNALSIPEMLKVNIRPPTPRKFPTVKQAASTPGANNGVLDPFQGTSGVTVKVPATEIDPGETVNVDFIRLGGEDGPGSIVGVGPITPGGLEFDIPQKVVAANVPVSGEVSKVEVSYWAGRDTQRSAVYTLTVTPFPEDSFGSVECDRAQIGQPATLSKATVAQDGANIQIEQWAYHQEAQKIKVWAMANNVRTDFLMDAPTPITDGKFTTPLPKDFVEPLPVNTTFTLYAAVSLNQGQSYHPFKSMMIKLAP